MSKIFNARNYVIASVCLCFIAVVSMSLIGCNQLASEQNEYNTLKAGTLKVAVEENNYPAVYKNSNDKIVGVEINYLENLCKEAGFEIEYVTMDFNQIIDAVNRHDVDISINQISATAGRKQKVDFSEPYNKNGTSLYVKDDSGYTLDSLKQLSKDKELKIATLEGTYFDNLRSILEGTITNVPFSNMNDAIVAVQKGEADCLVYDSNPIALIDLTKNQHLKGVFLPEMPEYDIAIALNKNLKGMKEKLNPIMIKMNNSNYLNRVQEYFYTLDNPKTWDGTLPADK